MEGREGKRVQPGDAEGIKHCVRDERAEARGSPYSWDLSYPLQSNYC